MAVRGEAMVNVGVDLGGTALRAAFGPGGEAAGACEVRGWRWPWLLCEAPGPAGLPVEFPSLKSRLGIAASVRVGDETLDPEGVLAAGLREIRDTAVKATGARLGHTAIGVPARFSSRQRGALLRAAEAAGLPQVSLVSDSIAHVIAHAGTDTTGTYAVFDMGYTGFEIGLVRAVKGRYRALAYDGAAAPGGGFFDARTVASLLEFLLAGYGISPREMLRTEAMRRELRAAAEEIKERSAGGDGTFDARFGLRHVPIRLSQAVFGKEIGRFAAGAFDRIAYLLEEAGLRNADVTALLLAGGSTRMPVVRDFAAATGLTVTEAEPGSLETGALRYAAQLASRPSVVADAPPEPEAEEIPMPASETPPLPGLLQAPTAPEEDRTDAGAAAARRLLRHGRLDDAERAAREAVNEAEQVLQEVIAARSGAVQDPDRPPSLSIDSERLQARARRSFKQGEFQEAIHVMHVAAERGGPEVFAEMIQMHCEAAMTNPTMANFKRQAAWLRCAIGHDAGNVRLFDLLAERCLLHAEALVRIGRKTEARATVEEALKWNPDHDKARALGRELKPR
ncbi:Hsp70 family protein [Glycomyces rhizosphaerae]|uniref:Hsp70 family protein n=1 Tax=Glycomyces rhizosphaerae TaxID=2054422 RepID=A0ABV7PTL9_9ACTN